MAYEQKPNTGALFPNIKKTDNHPDFRGDVHLDKAFLENLITKSKGNLIKVQIAAWKKESSAGKKYMSLSASEPYVKESADPWEN